MQYIVGIIFGFLLSLTSCEQHRNNNTAGYTIDWNDNSLVCIAESGGYPRIHRLGNGLLMVTYEDRRGNVVVKQSSDEGATWSEPVIVFTRFEYQNEKNNTSCTVNIANPEFISLPDNSIALAVNFRPNKPEVYPFSIALKRSVDEGKTWLDEQVVYKAAPRFNDGCWEPSFLLLPDGTLQLYFANEYPYLHSDEQEISMFTSDNYGVTWSDIATTVCFRAGHRDGMPVPVLNGDEILVAIEDNVSGQFKPYIVQTSVANPWESPVSADSPKRYSALETPLPDTVYAGAPYFIRTENGMFVMSYQTTRNRTSNWELSTMEVVVSDSPADFKNPTYPFNVPLSKEAKWSALADLGNGEIAAVSSTNFNSDKIGVWMIKGKIIQKK
ncbi:MAG: sialidase family protein [Bacteroidia bacterium]|nr:sialidase family protein [Bacteroidia bacterium]